MVVGCGSGRVIRGVDSGGIGELVGMRVDSCGGNGGVGRGVGCGSGRVIRGVDCGGIGELVGMRVDHCGGGGGGVGRGVGGCIGSEGAGREFGGCVHSS